MKTEVEMKRELFGLEISQKSKSNFFSATDLIKAGNKWRAIAGIDLFNFNEWLRNKSTITFIAELESKYGDIKINSKGKNSHTWVHPLLFIDIALAISPKLKIEVYEWLFDNLIKFRNDSGDSYKEMTGALYLKCSNVRDFPRFITETANKIRIACEVEDWNHATQEQLEKRTKIHDAIVTVSGLLSNPMEIVEYVINNSK